MLWPSADKAYRRMRVALALLTLPILGASLLAFQHTGRPLLLLQGPATVLFVLLLFTPRTARGAILGKMGADLAMATWLFFMPGVDAPFAFGIVCLTAASWILINLHFLRSRFAHALLLAFLLLPLAREFAVWMGGGARPELSSILVALVPLLAQLLWVVETREREQRQELLDSLEQRTRQMEDFRRWTRTSGALLLHDVRNLLQATGYVDAAVAGGSCPEEVAAQLRRMKHQILTLLENRDREERAEIRVAGVLRRMFQGSPPGLSCFEIRVDPAARIVYHPRMFESIVYNLARNAWEAWQDRHDSWRELRILIAWEGRTLSLTDNAGGFDPAAIGPGNTRKKTGSGQFLATLMGQQAQLGIAFGLERHPSGMRAWVEFLPAPETPPAV